MVSFARVNRPGSALTYSILCCRWTNPFGLSQSLKLGPNLALQIGIVYAGPFYPSEIGVAAGIAINDVQGKAALLLSESPNTELIMLQFDNLGIRDVVKFASKLLQANIAQPDDFLHFNQVKIYLSTGAMIGTIYYPPGASFSCDAVIFGKRAQIFCGIDKAQRQIRVTGSLDPIDIGPLSVSGYDEGTPAHLDVQIGVGSAPQTLLIDGGVHFLDMFVRIRVNAMLLPSPAFDLRTDLQFTAHLTFTLTAYMRGSFQHVETLDFEIHAFMQQNILDYIAAQVNTQILAGKHAVDDGIGEAKVALDQAQKDFDARIAIASREVGVAPHTRFQNGIRVFQRKIEMARVRRRQRRNFTDDPD